MLAGKPVHTAMAEVIRSVAPAVAAAGLVLASSLGTLILESGQAARQQGFAMAFGIPPASPGRLVDPGSSAHRPGFATSVAAPRFHTRAHRDGTTQAARASAFRVGPRQ
jgi:hypothetical protein